MPGGTRLAPDVTVAEVALLARAMTYKFAALGDQVGGAKAGVRGDAADPAARAGLMARYCAEIRPLAIEGFGKVGGGVAREVTSRGGRAAGRRLRARRGLPAHLVRRPARPAVRALAVTTAVSRHSSGLAVQLRC